MAHTHKNSDGITDAMDMNLGKLQGVVRDRDTWCATSPRGCKESDMTERLNNKPHKANWLAYWTVQIQNIPITGSALG